MISFFLLKLTHSFIHSLINSFGKCLQTPAGARHCFRCLAYVTGQNKDSCPCRIYILHRIGRERNNINITKLYRIDPRAPAGDCQPALAPACLECGGRTGEWDPEFGPPHQASRSLSIVPNGSHTTRPFLKGNPFCVASVTWAQQCHRFSRAGANPGAPRPVHLTTPFSHWVPRNSLCHLLTSGQGLGDHKPAVVVWMWASWRCQVKFLSSGPGSDGAWLTWFAYLSACWFWTQLGSEVILENGFLKNSDLRCLFSPLPSG